MNYASRESPARRGPGEFVRAAAALDHGHIYGMCNGLTEAGATLKYVYDSDPEKVEAFRRSFPGPGGGEFGTNPGRPGGAIGCRRCGDLGALSAWPAGDGWRRGLFLPTRLLFTTLEQLEAARQKVRETGRKYMVYYSERLHVRERSLPASSLSRGDWSRASGSGMGPHRLSAAGRPAWFFEHARYGGILCDIGSHQIEQYLYYSGAKRTAGGPCQVANYNHPQSRVGGFRRLHLGWATMAPPIISVWTGSRPTGFPPGGRSLLHPGERMVTSKSVNMSM